MKRLVSAALIGGAVLAAPVALADTLPYRSEMSGPQEEPPNASPGTSVATIIIDTTAHTMQLSIPFSGLTTFTTAAHIHCCTGTPGSGVAAPATTTPTLPEFPLGVTAGSYDMTMDLLAPSTYSADFLYNNGGTAAGAEAALLAGLAANTAYLNIHTTAYPAGEIRGFIALVPEPSTWLMMLAGLGALGMARRRKTG